MPAIDLTRGSKTLSRYDVVGVRSESLDRFVIHVGLLDEDKCSLEAGGTLSAVHMRPPLKQGDTIQVNVAGHVPLTNDEWKIIETWLVKIADEYKKLGVGARDQFMIHPHWKDECDPKTGVRRYRRYSCAGFVLDAHQQVNIELLNIDEGVLPAVDRQVIISAYPNVEGHPDRLRSWGLEGTGPWRLVLAGYVLHALNRPTDQIRQDPYRAKEGDHNF